jgi:hypothetical protein
MKCLRMSGNHWNIEGVEVGKPEVECLRMTGNHWNSEGVDQVGVACLQRSDWVSESQWSIVMIA